jgi:hypothetical protein
LLPDYIDIPNDATDHSLFSDDVQLLEAYNIPKARKSSMFIEITMDQNC